MAASLRTVLADARASRVPAGIAQPSVSGVAAIARVEARKLLQHPSFWVTVGACFLLVRGLAGGVESDGPVGVNVSFLLAGVLVGLLFGTVLSANVAALRPRRDHLGELFGSLPSPPETRTAGLLAGLLMGPFLCSIVFTALGWWAATHIADPRIHPEEVDWFLVVQVPLSVVALGALAIAVGRWIPSIFGGPAIIAGHLFTGLIWAVPWIAPRSSGIDPTWHLVYLAAAITTWVAFALARDRSTVWRLAIAGGAFALGVVAAIRQIPPGGY
jgi:hypothetical protein